MQAYYQFKIDLLMQLHKKDPSKGYDADALNTSERSRARGLVELLAEAEANIRKGLDPKLLATEQLLLNKIDAIQKQIQELPATNKETRIERLKKESDNLLTQYRELQTKIRTTSPEYAAIQYPGTRKEAEAILKLVSPSQSLHAYDFDANYNFANSKELKQYRFLLFATHGTRCLISAIAKRCCKQIAYQIRFYFLFALNGQETDASPVQSVKVVSSL